jgi:hypothetical protein
VNSGARQRAGIPAGHHRLAARLDDVSLLQRASVLIADLCSDLDRRLELERRPAERRQMLLQTSNRITRAANDAVQAYARTSRAIREELSRPDADVPTAQAIRSRLDTARRDVLRALEVAKRRYPAVEESAANGLEADT